jgi:hypothetical protein
LWGKASAGSSPTCPAQRIYQQAMAASPIGMALLFAVGMALRTRRA